MILLGSLLYSPISATILFTIVAVAMLFEYFKTCFINRAEGFSYLFVGIVISLGYILLSIKYLQEESSIIHSFYGVAMIYALINAILLLTKTKVLISRPWHMIQGFFYVAMPVFLLIHFLLNVRDSNWIILGVFVLIWVSDSAAYFVGSQFGKHKLFESISPKKTWEGSIGAGIFTMIAAYILSLFPLVLDLSSWMIIGIIVWIFGTLGDLVESSYKRHFKIKDSGAIMPGHGGLLDRFDSFIFSIAFILYYLNYIQS